MSPILRAAAPPVVIALLALAPFLDKAFTIDDPAFLLEARHALADPLHPTAFEMAWNTAVPERVSTMMPSGPVAAWLLLPAVAAGGAEWMAHLIQFVMLAFAAIATVAVAMRLGLSAWWASAAGVLLVTTPAVMGMAGTAMPDVPAMALGILGVERLLAWRQEGGWFRAVSGAALLALAPLARSHLAALLALGPLLLGADALRDSGRIRANARILWPFGLALAIGAAVLIVTRDPGRGSGDLLTATSALSSPSKILFNALCFGTHWVLATAFALSWLVLRLSAITRRWWVLVLATAAFAAVRWLQTGDAAPLWIEPVGALGITILLDVMLDALERRDGVQLALGAWLFVPLPVAIYTHLPSKYLVAAAPAACILLARLASRTPSLGRWVVGIAAGAGLILGTAIVRADARLAEVARSGIPRLLTPELLAGRTLWYDGHWGFHWYAEAAGARSWDATSAQPRPGDLILTNENRPIPLDLDAYRALVHLRRYEDGRPGGRVMSIDAGAGFFSNAWGCLPWSWGDDTIDAIDLWLAPGGATPPPVAGPTLIRAP